MPWRLGRVSVAKEAIKERLTSQFASISHRSSSPLSTELCNQLVRPTNFDPQHPRNYFDRHLLLSSLFKELKSPSHVLEVKKLHAVLIVSGLSTGGVFGSQLVHVYVKFGCFDEAFKLFGELPQKSSVAYNAVLRGLVDRGQFSGAIEFFDWMTSHGAMPDNFTYPLVFKACSLLGALEEGKRVQNMVRLNEIKLGLEPNVYVHCAMIDLFAKCGSLEEAWRVFDEIPVKDLACWSAVISGAVHNSEFFEALCLFKRMRLEGLKPDSVIVAVILPACSALENKHNGMALQGCATKSGFERDAYVSNALIDMYCKCGDTGAAHKLFCRMTDKDTVSWSTMISGYSQNCRYRQSVELFLEMKSSGLRTNAVVASSVLPGLGKLKLLKLGKEMHGYVLKVGFESDIVLICAMIDMYMNCGSEREAELIFKAMHSDNIMVWNSMIVGYSVNGETNSALGIFRSIWKYNVRPNSVTLLSVIPLCTRVGNLRHGKEIHGYATRIGLEAIVSVENSLLDMYCKCGYLDLGMKLFDSMVEKNVVTYNTVISGLASHGLGQSALLVFKRMDELGVRPNRVTFSGILSACSHAGLVSQGLSLYNLMINKYKIVPEMEHYSCIVDLLGRAGQLDRAWKFIRDMPTAPDMNVLGSLLGACKVHSNVELAEVVRRHIFENELNDSGFHTLLHNIYASSEQWNEALMIRRMMKERGLGKVAGSSWIQTGGSFHTFHASSGEHPQLDSIHEILNCLLWDMKYVGFAEDETCVDNTD